MGFCRNFAPDFERFNNSKKHYYEKEFIYHFSCVDMRNEQRGAER